MKKLITIFCIFCLCMFSCEEDKYGENNPHGDNTDIQDNGKVEYGINLGMSKPAISEEVWGGASIGGNDLIGIQVRENSSSGKVIAAGLFRGNPGTLKVKLTTGNKYYIEATAVKNSENVSGGYYGTKGAPFNRAVNTNPSTWTNNPSAFTNLSAQCKAPLNSGGYVTGDRWYYRNTITAGSGSSISISMKRVSFRVRQTGITNLNPGYYAVTRFATNHYDCSTTYGVGIGSWQVFTCRNIYSAYTYNTAQYVYARTDICYSSSVKDTKAQDAYNIPPGCEHTFTANINGQSVRPSLSYHHCVYRSAGVCIYYTKSPAWAYCPWSSSAWRVSPAYYPNSTGYEGEYFYVFVDTKDHNVALQVYGPDGLNHRVSPW